MLLDRKNGIQHNVYLTQLTQRDYKPLGIIKATKRNPEGWFFDWRIPLESNFQVHALFATSKPAIVQGLIALRPNHNPDFLCVEVMNVESVFHNKAFNPDRRYAGVGEHLMAFACKVSINEKFDGFVQFTSKTTTIPFYQRIGAQHIGNGAMYINTMAAEALIRRCNL
jgi:hypothetical protein